MDAYTLVSVVVLFNNTSFKMKSQVFILIERYDPTLETQNVFKGYFLSELSLGSWCWKKIAREDIL